MSSYLFIYLFRIISFIACPYTIIQKFGVDKILLLLLFLFK